MKDFTYYAPTEVVFGATSEEKTGKLVKQYGGTNVLVHYGGQSAVRSGLLGKICRILEAEGIAYTKLGGVVPNPRLSMVHEGIELCRKEGIDFILAVGGGSVIDSAKAIAFGVPYKGDVWDFAKEFGYEIHDRQTFDRVNRTFKAVKREWRGVNRLFGDILDEFCEIN